MSAPPRTLELIDALLRTAARIEAGADYQWGHLGACNCGHLAQTITELSPAQIHAAALRRSGDWADQAVEYCPGSGYPIDHILDKMMSLGLNREDIRHLERLSDRRVLARMGERGRALHHNRRADVVAYMRAWAGWLSEESGLLEQPEVQVA
ncbi:MAG: hypothetical protein H6741_15305 [Alphaproteobacteria bacterium]|nr:hypothetical protein [Alphaproteobacteria bacterium]